MNHNQEKMLRFSKNSDFKCDGFFKEDCYNLALCQILFVYNNEDNEDFKNILLPKLIQCLPVLYKLSTEHDVNSIVLKQFFNNCDWNIQLL